MKVGVDLEQVMGKGGGGYDKMHYVYEQNIWNACTKF